MTNDTNDPSLDVVGIGNAIVDVLTTTDDALLEKLSFDKGSMSLIDENNETPGTRHSKPKVL